MESVFSANFVSLPLSNDLPITSSRQCPPAKDSTIHPYDFRLKSVSATTAQMVSTSSVSTSSQTHNADFYCLKEDRPGKRGISLWIF